MQVVVGETEAHEHTGRVQHVVEQRERCPRLGRALDGARPQRDDEHEPEQRVEGTEVVGVVDQVVGEFITYYLFFFYNLLISHHYVLYQFALSFLLLFSHLFALN